MDPLVEIPRTKWPELRDLYKTHWPDGAEAFCLLDFQLAYPQLTEEFNFHVYCPEGNLTYGMVATLLRDGYYQVIIQPVGKDIAKIEECLRGTKIIDWNKDIMVPFANLTAIGCLDKIKHELGLHVFYGVETKAYIHFLDKNSNKFVNLTLPPNTYIGILQSEHIATVDKTWTYQSKNSYKLFEILLKNNLAYVLYMRDESKAEEHRTDTKDEEEAKSGSHLLEKPDSILKGNPEASVDLETEVDRYRKKSSDEPLAWLSVNEHGALSHLFCSEHHRKKGFAEIITKYVANELLSKGHNVIAYTTENNINPQKLFSKLGFKDIGYDYWVMVNKTA